VSEGTVWNDKRGKGNEKGNKKKNKLMEPQSDKS
jgi:hypothetical protein